MSVIPDATRKQRQQQALDDIVERVTEHGYAPSVREVADDLGWSVARTQETIVELIEAGCLRRPPRLNRGLAVLREKVDPG